MKALGSALVVVALVAGCGGSADDGQSATATTERELLSRVSAGIAASPRADDDIAYVDFAGAREQLGLPANADVYGTQRANGKQFSVLTSVANRALLYAGRPMPTPLLRAVDGGAIEAAAGLRAVIGGPALLVIKTEQPFHEISKALRADGYVDDGEFLVSDRPDSVYPIVSDAEGEILVMAASESVAHAALEGRAARLTRAANLIGDLPGVARAASTRRNQCIVARAAGQDLAPQQGEYLVVVEGAADAERMRIAGKTLAGVQDDLTFGAAEAEGSRARAKFTSEDTVNAVFADLVDDESLASRTKGSGLPYAC